MKQPIFICLSMFLLIILCFGCENDRETEKKASDHLAFEKEKWQVKEGGKYSYRPNMLNEIVYTDTLRKLSKRQVLERLGAADRHNENYYYYLIDETKIGAFTLHTRTMVVKFNEVDSVEWIKIHE